MRSGAWGFFSRLFDQSGMDLRIADALSDGIGRLTTRDGLLLAGLLYAITVLNGVLNAVLLGGRGDGVGPGAGTGVPGASGAAPVGGPGALVPSSGAAFGLSLLLGLASAVVVIGALRVFVTGEELSEASFTRNLPLALVNYVLGGIVYAVVVTIGLALLVLPGIFLMVVLGFWTVYVAVEDRSFPSAFGDSWRLTEGNRLRLFGLGLAVVVVGIAVSIPFALVSGAIGVLFGGGVVARVVGATVSGVGSAITTVITLGTLAAAYRQLATGATATGTSPEAGVLG
jgi:hypothetical protein